MTCERTFDDAARSRSGRVATIPGLSISPSQKKSVAYRSAWPREWHGIRHRVKSVSLIGPGRRKRPGHRCQPRAPVRFRPCGSPWPALPGLRMRAAWKTAAAGSAARSTVSRLGAARRGVLRWQCHLPRGVPTQQLLDGLGLHQVVGHAPLPSAPGIAAMKRLAHDARER